MVTRRVVKKYAGQGGHSRGWSRLRPRFLYYLRAVVQDSALSPAQAKRCSVPPSAAGAAGPAAICRRLACSVIAARGLPHQCGPWPSQHEGALHLAHATARPDGCDTRRDRAAGRRCPGAQPDARAGPGGPDCRRSRPGKRAVLRGLRARPSKRLVGIATSCSSTSAAPVSPRAWTARSTRRLSKASTRPKRRQVQQRLPRALPHDPRYFTTSVAVTDLEAVRLALGYPSLNLYGVVLWYPRRAAFRAPLSGLDAHGRSRRRRAAANFAGSGDRHGKPAGRRPDTCALRRGRCLQRTASPTFATFRDVVARSRKQPVAIVVPDPNSGRPRNSVRHARARRRGTAACVPPATRSRCCRC